MFGAWPAAAVAPAATEAGLIGATAVPAASAADPKDGDGADTAVLARACDWLRAGERVALITVICSWGSPPRPPRSVAHDPRLDDLALIEALAPRAFYVGALGTERSAASRRERLAQMGLTHVQIRRLHVPAGLPIGSKRPAEIAVSILAETTSVRNGLVASPAEA